MAADPYRCDAVFSIALLVVFCSVTPAILTLALPDWIVVTEKYHHRQGYDQKCPITGNDGNKTICKASRNENISSVTKQPTDAIAEETSSSNQSADQVTSQDNEVETSQLIDTLDVVTTPSSGNNRTENNFSEVTTERALLSVTSPTSDENKEKDEMKSNQNNTTGHLYDRPKRLPEIIADFVNVCFRNSSSKMLNCKPFSFANNSQELLTCANKQNASSRSFEENLECNVIIVNNAFAWFSRYAFFTMIVAVVLCIVCAIAIDYLAIVDKGAAKTKVILGMLLLTSGTAQLVVMLNMHFIIFNIDTLLEGKVSYSSASYFCTVNIAMCYISTILLIISARTERQKPPEPESKLDVPFQNSDSTNSPEKYKIGWAASDGFIEIHDEESEDWGFHPFSSDTAKEVRFKLDPTFLDENTKPQTPTTDEELSSPELHFVLEDSENQDILDEGEEVSSVLEMKEFPSESLSDTIKKQNTQESESPIDEQEIQDQGEEVNTSHTLSNVASSTHLEQVLEPSNDSNNTSRENVTENSNDHIILSPAHPHEIAKAVSPSSEVSTAEMTGEIAYESDLDQCLENATHSVFLDLTDLEASPSSSSLGFISSEAQIQDQNEIIKDTIEVHDEYNNINTQAGIVSSSTAPRIYPTEQYIHHKNKTEINLILSSNDQQPSSTENELPVQPEADSKAMTEVQDTEDL